jgi:hypothetical protein
LISIPQSFLKCALGHAGVSKQDEQIVSVFQVQAVEVYSDSVDEEEHCEQFAHVPLVECGTPHPDRNFPVSQISVGSSSVFEQELHSELA